jgi:hypothetical protein
MLLDIMSLMLLIFLQLRLFQNHARLAYSQLVLEQAQLSTYWITYRLLYDNGLCSSLYVEIEKISNEKLSYALLTAG